MDHNKPLLTLAHVRGWESRLIEIDESIRAQTEERSVLLRKIDAAKVFMDFLVDQDDPASADMLVDVVPDPDTADAPDESMSQAVLAAVIAMGGSPKPAAIRRWIKTNNPTVGVKLDVSPGYLYTALMRHVRGGRLAKTRKGYRLPMKSPSGITGGVAPPASTSATEQNGKTYGGTEERPEVGGI